MSASTMQAHPAGEHEAVAVHPGGAGMPTALVGMLLFIASEVMFFGGLFATYFNARASVGPGNWHPPEGAHELDLPLAAVLTAILVASSFTMQFGVWAIRRGDNGALRMWTGITLALGVLFLAGQLYDYSQLGFGIADGPDVVLGWLEETFDVRAQDSLGFSPTRRIVLGTIDLAARCKAELTNAQKGVRSLKRIQRAQCLQVGVDSSDV